MMSKIDVDSFWLDRVVRLHQDERVRLFTSGGRFLAVFVAMLVLVQVTFFGFPFFEDGPDIFLAIWVVSLVGGWMSIPFIFQLIVAGSFPRLSRRARLAVGFTEFRLIPLTSVIPVSLAVAVAGHVGQVQDWEPLLGLFLFALSLDTGGYILSLLFPARALILLPIRFVTGIMIAGYGVGWESVRLAVFEWFHVLYLLIALVFLFHWVVWITIQYFRSMNKTHAALQLLDKYTAGKIPDDAIEARYLACLRKIRFDEALPEEGSAEEGEGEADTASSPP